MAARGEQYLPAMVFFATLSFVNLIVAAKLLICIVWIGAGVSKFGRHFTNVVPPMVSNSPCTPGRRIRRAHYRDFPRDLRPSKLASFMAHVGGSTVEIATPLVLLFSRNHTLTVAAVVLMVVFHAFIISTFPLAVPLEWNLLFAYLTVFLFLAFENTDGYGLGDIDPRSGSPSRRRCSSSPCWAGRRALSLGHQLRGSGTRHRRAHGADAGQDARLGAGDPW